MMKKTYIQPETDVIEIRTLSQLLLSGSRVISDENADDNEYGL